MSATKPAAVRSPEPMDLEAVGMAIALAALAHHAAHLAHPSGSEALDALARAVAFVLLPGWAAARFVPKRIHASMFEMGAAVVGLGAALAALAGWLARGTGLGGDLAGTLLAVASLGALAPRRAPAAAASGSGPSVYAAIAGATAGTIGLALAAYAPSALARQPLVDLLASSGAAGGVRAAGILCAALLALSGAALVRRWTHSAAAALAAALLIAGGAASIVFASHVRPAEPATPAGAGTAPATAVRRP